MRSPPKKYPRYLSLSLYLMRLGRRLGRWSEGRGLAPRLLHYCLREKAPHAA
ncbi:MAG: hypothetical protein IT573_06780 [Deltaproteobacteria bacterium]|nr:hypothetical protein [Deltaproteobacteria bacterium]